MIRPSTPTSRSAAWTVLSGTQRKTDVVLPFAQPCTLKRYWVIHRVTHNQFGKCKPQRQSEMLQK